LMNFLKYQPVFMVFYEVILKVLENLWHLLQLSRWIKNLLIMF
jgi:hypothetical protein